MLDTERPTGTSSVVRWAVAATTTAIAVALFLVWTVSRSKPPLVGVSAILMQRETYPKIVFKVSVTNLTSRPMIFGRPQLTFRTESGGYEPEDRYRFVDIPPDVLVPPGAVQRLLLSRPELDNEAHLYSEYFTFPGPAELWLGRALTKLGLKRPGSAYGERHTYQGPWLSRVATNEPVDLSRAWDYWY